VAPTRFALTLLGVFAVSALFLASIGLYGTMALMVRTRTNEIGIHMAMGAPPTAVGRRVVARTLVLASLGVFGGFGAAMVLTRFLEAHLVEISATDPASFALAAVVQMAVAVVAAWIPARRAAAVNPVTALRFD
jgi:ABC-type antimicrobial peptide transport system permease subunit